MTRRPRAIVRHKYNQAAIVEATVELRELITRETNTLVRHPDNTARVGLVVLATDITAQVGTSTRGAVDCRSCCYIEVDPRSVPREVRLSK
ncbi:hypothetical protein D3C78_1752670 [compost metagenome]